MVDRRKFIQLSVGSLAATLAWPAGALGRDRKAAANTVVIYHEDAPEGPQFFRELLEGGAELFPIAAVLDRSRKDQLYRRLMKSPTTVVALTDTASAFELQMAARDAFHYTMPKERFATRNNSDGSLVAWAVAPISEIQKGS